MEREKAFEKGLSPFFILFFAGASPAGSQPPHPPCPKEDLEPLTKPLANRSCVPAVASGKAERARGLTDYEGKPLSVRVLVKITKLSPCG